MPLRTFKTTVFDMDANKDMKGFADDECLVNRPDVL